MDDKTKKMQSIKELRATTYMSQSAFAEYFGIPASTLRDWEHARRTPPSYVIEMMQRILDLEKNLGITPVQTKQNK